jgi:hypothetical protein
MFPCQFRIPGHSGADFKHRKPFIKIKEHLNKRKRAASVYKKSFSSSSLKTAKSKFSKNDVSHKLLKWISAAILVVLCLSIFFLAENVARSVITDLGTDRRKSTDFVDHQKIKAFNNAYFVLTTTGNAYLEGNMLDEAQTEFARALKINKRGKLAILGMTKTLMKKCAQEGKYCEEANEYLEYVKIAYGESFNEIQDLVELKAYTDRFFYLPSKLNS